jgi:hypothetical protein
VGNKVRGHKGHLVAQALVHGAHLANAAVGVVRDKFLLGALTTLHVFC